MKSISSFVSNLIYSASIAMIVLIAISGGAALATAVPKNCGTVTAGPAGGFNCGATVLPCGLLGNKPCNLPVFPVVSNPCTC